MSGNFFSMEDGEQNPKEAKQSRNELQNLKNEFMDRARQFMDDTAIGDGRKILQNFVRKLQGEEAPLEEEVAPPAEEWDDEDDWEEPTPENELDWSRPEYIRAGYAKPGTSWEEPRSLEEAQEESFSLKMGNLSGLLSRFGSEDAVPEEQAPKTGIRFEMDKPLFQSQMQTVYQRLADATGQKISPELWLTPEVLTLFRAQNTPRDVLLFVMAGLFASTSENYLTQADLSWVSELLHRAGFLIAPEDIQRQVQQTFMFPERVHRLYQHLLDTPPQLQLELIETYQQNLAKMYIFEVAKHYNADPQTIIRTLSSHWQNQGQQLVEALKAVAHPQQQYERFQQRKMASASLFQKLRQAEEAVLVPYQKLRQLSHTVEDLKQVTRLLEEEDALHKLEQFQTDLFLDSAENGAESISLPELRTRFVKAQFSSQGPQTGAVQTEYKTVQLGPVEQKHAIARAKEGELKSLKLIQMYKNGQLQPSQKKPVSAPEA